MIVTCNLLLVVQVTVLGIATIVRMKVVHAIFDMLEISKLSNR